MVFGPDGSTNDAAGNGANMRRNAFLYLYILQGDYGYGHGWEDLSAEDKAQPGAWKRVVQTRKEYRDNEGGTYRIIERREPNPAALAVTS